MMSSDEVKTHIANKAMDVARAAIMTTAPRGVTISQQIGDTLAERLAIELAGMLAAVMPSAAVKSIGDDVLKGAEEIAEFVYGNTSDRRKVYHLAQTSKIPVFRMGAMVCARKSTLLKWIEDQETKTMGAAS